MANVLRNIIDRFKSPPPATGQQTGKQGASGGTSLLHGQMLGFGEAPVGSVKLYREMRGNPTIAMARAAAYAPVKASQWTIEEEEGAPAGAVEFIEKAFLPMRSALLKDLRFSLDYGHAGFEKVYEYAKVDGSTKLILKQLKPLLTEKTKIITQESGAFAGLEQGEVRLGPEKSYLFTYDGEAGDLNGRARHENIRSVYHCWKQTLDRTGCYVTKSSGVTPVLRYPEGHSKDVNGVRTDNSLLAFEVLKNLGKGLGVAMPDVPARWARKMMQQGESVKDAQSWRLEFMEVASGHGAEYVALLQHFEKLFVRGWLVPERAVTEATIAGSRADSESSADLALLIAQELLDDIMESVNANVIDDLLEYNYGPEARGMVYVKAEPLDDKTRALVRSLIKEVLVNPQNADVFFRVLDVDNMLDQVGLPRVADTATVELAVKQQEDEAAKAVAQQLGQMQAKPAAQDDSAAA